MTPAGIAQLKLDEGLKLKAYPDPETKAAPWTIGYGCTGSGINKDTVWTQVQADGAILARVHLIEVQLGYRLKFFMDLSPVRRDVLTNIAYNIGIAGLMRWPITLAAVGRDDFEEAARDIRTNTVWKNQVGDRVDRCADALENNTWTSGLS